MCSKATEIQERWEPKHGDRISSALYPPLLGLTDYSDLPEDVKNAAIWLPCIEDLVEILKKACPNFTEYYFMAECVAWVDDGPPFECDCLAEVWLRFVMHKLYNKTFNGEWEIAK